MFHLNIFSLTRDHLEQEKKKKTNMESDLNRHMAEITKFQNQEKVCENKVKQCRMDIGKIQHVGRKWHLAWYPYLMIVQNFRLICLFLLRKDFDGSMALQCWSKETQL